MIFINKMLNQLKYEESSLSRGKDNHPPLCLQSARGLVTVGDGFDGPHFKILRAHRSKWQ
jgi:hypothetical protein